MTKDVSGTLGSKSPEWPMPMPAPTDALEEVRQSMDRFCLLVGIEVLGETLEKDTAARCEPRSPPGRAAGSTSRRSASGCARAHACECAG